VPWCYSKPVGYYEALAQRHGEFQLPWYWGPLAGSKASEWIARAALDTIEQHRPTLTCVYLPHLDYNTQRFGPSSPQALEDLRQMDRIVAELLDGLDRSGLRDETAVVVLTEYAMTEVSRPVLLNRALREQSLVEVRTIGGHEYLDLELSTAFAMVDHQVAHIYVKPDQLGRVRAALDGVDGVDRLLDREEQHELQIDHLDAGELIAVAEPDAWFAYYWWLDDAQAPPYAREIDIHRKPAYDPCELFFDPATRGIPLEPERIRGSHGRPAASATACPALIVSAPEASIADREQPEMADVPIILLGLLGHGR
jgi:predicted AlkP superfamily pyrophosphatase or phosphodiesterase